MFAIMESTPKGDFCTMPMPQKHGACDQCRMRKVRCDARKPCVVCIEKGFACTYEKARRKRGPTGKRIAEIREIQGAMTATSPTTVEIPLSEVAQTQRSDDTPSMETPFATSDTWDMDMSGSLWSPSVLESISTSDFETVQIPSFPIDSPTDGNAFASLPDAFREPEAKDVWPAIINEESLLPWIDVFFKRLHPTMPILDRATLYQDMLLRKHRRDKQYGSMLLTLTAFSMTQPVQIEEHASLPSRTVQARMMMEEAVKMRATADFGENPCIPSVLTSFFLFACLFGSNRRTAALHKLREAVDLARSLGMQDPAAYDRLDVRDREQWIRIYLVLSVTERAYALQQRHPIGFRGRPSLFAEMLQGSSSTGSEGGITGLISEDKADSMALTGLLYTMQSFDAIDETIAGCWNGECPISDGQCSAFDRRLAIKAFRALRIARESSLSGKLSVPLNVSPLSLGQLGETQRVDITMVQLWLLNRLWNLCLTHQLVLQRSEHIELSSDFPLYLAEATLMQSQAWNMRSMEVHGIGLAEKIFDISVGALTTLRQLPDLGLSIMEQSLDRSRIDYPLMSPDKHLTRPLKVRGIVTGLESVLHAFRRGQHPYAARFSSELETVPVL